MHGVGRLKDLGQSSHQSDVAAKEENKHLIFSLRAVCINLKSDYGSCHGHYLKILIGESGPALPLHPNH